MTEKTTVGARLPQEYVEEIDLICKRTGKTRSDILLEAVQAYLGKNSPDSVQSTLEMLQEKVDLLEKKLNVGALSHHTPTSRRKKL